MTKPTQDPSTQGRKEKFLYREFYDVPRMIILRYRGSQLLLDCQFDDHIDEYQDVYKVYVLPNISSSELQGSWENLPSKATKYVGEVLVSDVQFDPTLRSEISTAVLDSLF